MDDPNDPMEPMGPKDKGLFVLLVVALSATSAGMIVNAWPY